MPALLLVSMVASIGLACFIRAKLSGQNLGFVGFSLCLLFSVSCVAFYMGVATAEYIAFYGYWPGLHEDYPVVGWGALISAVAHALLFRA